VTLSASSNPVTYGSTETFTVTLLPTTVTGNVTFYSNTTVLGIAPSVNGAATFTTDQLPSGSQSIVARFDGDDSESAPLPLTVNAIQGLGFTNGTPYSTDDDSPVFVAVGDFNMDGYPDLVLPTASPSQIYVFLNNGNGTFQLPTGYGFGTALSSVTVGDFNGDGKPDLAVTDSADPTGVAPNYVWILLGNGDGTFQSPVAYQLTVAPNDVVVGDFNGDGIEDLAIAGNSFTSGTSTTDVNVLLGIGNGTFQAPAAYSTGTVQTSALALTVGDFNLDGNPDLAITNSGDGVGDTFNTVTILTGSANGTFAMGATLTVGDFPDDIATSDFNGDGYPDLAVANSDDGTVSVLLGNGNGTFQTQEVYNIPVSNSEPAGTVALPSALKVGDFNGDGIPDLAVASFVDGVNDTVSLFYGTASGVFEPAVNYPAGATPVSMAEGDFNGDGSISLVTAIDGDQVTTFGDANVLLAQGCDFLVSPNAFDYDNRGYTAPLSITTPYPACTWTATTNVPWVQLFTSGGSGSGEFYITIPQNTTGLERTGTITVAGVTVPVIEWATEQVFTDVPPTDYQFDAVNLLYEKGITSGCGTDIYCPYENIPRDQMAVFIVRSVYNGTDNFTYNPTPYFNDVTPSTFGFAWIQKMYELGITTGCGFGNFCPTETVTRAEMAVFIIRARYAATTVFTYPEIPYFTDVQTGSFAFEWIQRLKEDSITSGCTDTTYCPSEFVTRGDMAIFVMRGGFNQLLPAGTPLIVGVSPTTLTQGTSNTFTLTGTNTNFVQGQTVVVGTGGVSAGTVTVETPTTATVTLTATSDALLQPEPIYVRTGTQEAVLPNGLTVVAP
jgi:hypothetical protein